MTLIITALGRFLFSWKTLEDPNGLALIMVEPLALQDEDMADGNDWNFISEETYMRFDLDPNFAGKIQLNVTPFALNLDGSIQMSESIHLITFEVGLLRSMISISCKISLFKVQESNDAPKARPAPLLETAMPIVPFKLEGDGAQENGFFVKDLVRKS